MKGLKKIVRIKNAYATIVFLFLFQTIHAQEKLSITLAQADSLFVGKNFNLLAASMNIEAQKAQIIQAKVYPNPTFSTDFNVYDPDNNKFLHVGKSGDKAFRIEQLIILGGKRKTEIEIAKTNANIAALEFQQLITQLKFQLHSNLFSIGQQQILLKRYNSQLSLLDTLLNAYQTQADKGNIPLKEVVRLKGAYLKLNNDRADLLKDYYASQAVLQTLLQTKEIIDFQFSEDEIKKYIKAIPVEELISIAQNNLADLLLAQQNKILAQQNFEYQKKLAIPDVSFNLNYTQRGGAFYNQMNAGISIPLPLWDKNKGNIASSSYKIKEADYNFKSIQNKLFSDINNAYAMYQQNITEYKKAATLYNNDVEITIKGMADNFQKRNISMIEFIDFFEAYNEAQTELARIRKELVIAGEQLNLLTGKEIY